MSDRDTLAELLKDRADRTSSFQFRIEHYQHLAEEALLEGWRPPARKIETVAELDELPVGSIVVDDDGDPWVLVERYDGGSRWRGAGIEGAYQAADLLEAHGSVVTR